MIRLAAEVFGVLAILIVAFYSVLLVLWAWTAAERAFRRWYRNRPGGTPDA